MCDELFKVKKLDGSVGCLDAFVGFVTHDHEEKPKRTYFCIIVLLIFQSVYLEIVAANYRGDDVASEYWFLLPAFLGFICGWTITRRCVMHLIDTCAGAYADSNEKIVNKEKTVSHFGIISIAIICFAAAGTFWARFFVPRYVATAWWGLTIGFIIATVIMWLVLSVAAKLTDCHILVNVLIVPILYGLVVSSYDFGPHAASDTENERQTICLLSAMIVGPILMLIVNLLWLIYGWLNPKPVVPIFGQRKTSEKPILKSGLDCGERNRL